MDHEILRFEVQRIDGTPASVERAIGLLTEEMNQADHLPKSIVYGFFEEFSKCLVEWMASGDYTALKSTWHHIQLVLRSHPDLSAPFAGSNWRKQFGAQLQILNEVVEVYLRSDMALKDRNTIQAPDSKTRRFRQVLAYMLQHEGPVNVGSFTEHPLFDKKSAKTIERDLQQLAALHFIRRTSDSERKAMYVLTNKTRSMRKLILEMADKEGRIPGKIVAVPASPVPAINPESLLQHLSPFRKTLSFMKSAVA